MIIILHSKVSRKNKYSTLRILNFLKTILLLSFKFLFLSLFKLSFHANIPYGKYFFSNFFLSGYTVNGTSCVPYTHISLKHPIIYLKIELAFLDYYPTRRRKNKCPILRILNLLKTILFYAIKNFFLSLSFPQRYLRRPFT